MAELISVGAANEADWRTICPTRKGRWRRPREAGELRFPALGVSSLVGENVGGALTTSNLLANVALHHVEITGVRHADTA